MTSSIRAASLRRLRRNTIVVATSSWMTSERMLTSQFTSLSPPPFITHPLSMPPLPPAFSTPPLPSRLFSLPLYIPCRPFSIVFLWTNEASPHANARKAGLRKTERVFEKNSWTLYKESPRCVVTFARAGGSASLPVALPTACAKLLSK